MTDMRLLAANLDRCIARGKVYGDDPIPAAEELLRLLQADTSDPVISAAIRQQCELAKDQIREALRRLEHD